MVYGYPLRKHIQPSDDDADDDDDGDDDVDDSQVCAAGSCLAFPHNPEVPHAASQPKRKSLINLIFTLFSTVHTIQQFAPRVVYAT